MALTVNYNDEGMPDGVPTYLFDQAETYRENPMDAALEWFTAAHLGISLHFGLSALLGKGESPKGVLTAEQYQELPKRFRCEHFDAIDIVEMTIAAGARYLSFPAVLPDGFCLYNTAESSFNSVNSAAQRDLVGELASTCEYHGIGLFLEYPFAENQNRYPNGIVQGLMPQTEYADFAKSQIHELLINYGPIAGIRFTGLKNLAGRNPAFDMADIYQMIHFLQPNALVSFQEGCNGKEDFFSATKLDDKTGFLAQNATQPVEIWRCLSGDDDRGFRPEIAGKHIKADDTWKVLKAAHGENANLMLNTALMPDGSLDLEDIQTLLALGERMERQGLA